MKKNIKILIAAAVVVFVLWNLAILLIDRTTSEMVQYGAMEDAFGTTLYLFKDEIVIGGADDGVLRPTAADGERVKKGARVGVVLSADTDEGTLHEYLRMEDRIERLRKQSGDAGYSATVRTDEQITALSLSVTAAAERGDMERVTGLKDELLLAKDEKSAAGGKKKELLALLEEEQGKLAKGIGNSIKEIYSPEAGVLLLQTDGMEKDMAVKCTEGLMPSALEGLIARTGNFGGGCKVLYSNVWKAACVVDAEVAERLSVGQTVSLRFHALDGVTERAAICEISEEEEGKCVVVFSSNRTPAGLMQNRQMTADVVLARYEGLRVPKEAICEENGQTGAFVQTITERVFRPAEVLFSDDTYAIIGEGEDTKLRLYDKVVY